MTAPLLEVQGLTKRFGGLTALNDVSFEVYPGEIVALIGPNGAGKTTLLHHLMGVLKPTAGKVIYKGQDITGRRPWDIVSRGLVGTFQVVKPFRNLPCVMNVVVASLVSRKKRGEWKAFLAREVESWRSFHEHWDGREGVLTVRFEDLLESSAETLPLLLDHLDLPADPETVARALGRYPPRGAPGRHVVHFDEEDRGLLRTHLGDWLERFAYDLEGAVV